MDRLASLEYSLMNDIYDDMINNSALESFDYFDEFFNNTDNYTDAFEAAAPGNGRVYKIWGFFRAVIKGISTFFKKIGTWIIGFFKKDPGSGRQVQVLELRRILDVAAGRLKDCMVDVKKKTIIFSEKIQKINLNNIDSGFAKINEALDSLISGVSDRTDDALAIQTKCADEWVKAEKKFKKVSGGSASNADDFKIGETVSNLKKIPGPRDNDTWSNVNSTFRPLLAQWLRNNYDKDCKALGQVYLQVSSALESYETTNSVQQQNYAARLAENPNARMTESEKAAESNSNATKEIMDKTRKMQAAVAEFNKVVLLSRTGSKGE